MNKTPEQLDRIGDLTEEMNKAFQVIIKAQESEDASDDEMMAFINLAGRYVVNWSIVTGEPEDNYYELMKRIGAAYRRAVGEALEEEEACAPDQS